MSATTSASDGDSATGGLTVYIADLNDAGAGVTSYRALVLATSHAEALSIVHEHPVVERSAFDPETATISEADHISTIDDLATSLYRGGPNELLLPNGYSVLRDMDSDSPTNFSHEYRGPA